MARLERNERKDFIDEPMMAESLELQLHNIGDMSIVNCQGIPRTSVAET